MFEREARVGKQSSMDQIPYHLVAPHSTEPYIGMSPSGKAHGFGPCIRGFESLHPSQDKNTGLVLVFLSCLLWSGFEREQKSLFPGTFGD